MRKINTVTVVGAGYMGGGIAQVLALNGFKVQIADVNDEATQEALKRLDREAREFEQQGLFGPGSADTIMSNLTASDSLDDAVSDVDYVMEAVFEDVDVKKEVLARVCASARPDTIIGTNTSTIPVKVLVDAVTHPERFLTVHFSNPAPFIPGVELVAGEATTQEVIDSVKDLLARAGREGAQVADTPGMALNRLQYALLKEATLIVEEGVATKEDVDTIVRTTFGFRLGFFGPFAIADQAGLDVYVKGYHTLENAFGERMATPKLLTDNVDAGRYGTKNGKGWTGDFDDETKAAVIAYRNKAYSRMGELLRELGPAPKGA
ncbi:3-hydroxyacyl-CoA dehydrogenase family protein [Mycolicibacterium smegmatis]|uniref:3-hydroxyacyl-CoA dehydrogenase family protein n=1 Tax=Mycolicibacterium smegmatis TaxID=1772 RepID=UPI0005D9F222|nr:3-hydroxyacyl-CoA dehydrogenase family protein [Mycolicibacterium smegmatis]MDF1897850.1 3-hydroxyacyl-CoA dehydrogenase family protein [Mycolicibacterium smegmatis]MDF1904406.1 3-hydroxyacyl-CoA dehydrogenase family protein [Mycolicibacterium smegmatis]MDF1917619.1 3-hydroxyacyl-CoA dehydrogenase family protein [Mycolicibacterium smegmatis]MDF1922976.1 3-hydroxyacyl-CoA dehydrogenase family protein [Mycolicibacterium smegmatis]UAK58107.1 3-hydroxyacyl-CoA dehydrogenase family protein [Myco